MLDDVDADYAAYEAEFATLIEAAWLEFKSEMEAGQHDPITHEQWLVDAEIDTDDRQTGWVTQPLPYGEFVEEWYDARRDVWNYV